MRVFLVIVSMLMAVPLQADLNFAVNGLVHPGCLAEGAPSLDVLRGMYKKALGTTHAVALSPEEMSRYFTLRGKPVKMLADSLESETGRIQGIEFYGGDALHFYFRTNLMPVDPAKTALYVFADEESELDRVREAEKEKAIDEWSFLWNQLYEDILTDLGNDPEQLDALLPFEVTKNPAVTPQELVQYVRQNFTFSMSSLKMNSRNALLIASGRDRRGDTGYRFLWLRLPGGDDVWIPSAALLEQFYIDTDLLLVVDACAPGTEARVTDIYGLKGSALDLVFTEVGFAD
jgi:hypothetical protein